MSKANNLTDFLTDTANAIRAKRGTTAKINPQNFSSEIANIPSLPNYANQIVYEENNSQRLTSISLRVAAPSTDNILVQWVDSSNKLSSANVTDGETLNCTLSGYIPSALYIEATSYVDYVDIALWTGRVVRIYPASDNASYWLIYANSYNYPRGYSVDIIGKQGASIDVID